MINNQFLTHHYKIVALIFPAQHVYLSLADDQGKCLGLSCGYPSIWLECTVYFIFKN